MSIKQQVSRHKLCNYAANRPDIGEFVPLAAFENDFRRAVLPGADDWAVKFVKFGGTSEIDHSDFVGFGQINLFCVLRPAFKHE